MKKLIVAFTLILSSFAFANDDVENTGFFSSSSSIASNSDIGVVDDPDPSTPINDYILPLIAVATVLGIYYIKKKDLLKN